MNVLHSYLSSFKVTRAYWASLLMEIVGLAVIFFFLTFYAQLIQARTLAITGGQPIEQVKLSLLQATPEAAQAFLTNVKIWAVLMLAGSVFVTLLSLFLFSYTQSAVWHILLNHKFSWKKAYWRWSAFTIVLGIALVLYLLIYALFRLLTNPLVATAGDTAYPLITNTINGIFTYAFLLFLFLAFYSFIQKQKVWESIGFVFSLLKTHRNSLWKFFLLVLLTGVLLSIILYVLQKNLLWSPTLSILVNIVVFILFYSWMRFYFLRTMEHSS